MSYCEDMVGAVAFLKSQDAHNILLQTPSVGRGDWMIWKRHPGPPSKRPGFILAPAQGAHVPTGNVAWMPGP